MIEWHGSASGWLLGTENPAETIPLYLQPACQASERVELAPTLRTMHFCDCTFTSSFAFCVFDPPVGFFPWLLLLGSCDEIKMQFVQCSVIE